MPASVEKVSYFFQMMAVGYWYCDENFILLGLNSVGANTFKSILKKRTSIEALRLQLMICRCFSLIVAKS